MKRISKERIKSIVLLILLLTSIIEVGILWFYQNHGLPISFLSGLFTTSSSTSSNVNDEYFKPYRMVLSGGIELHWIVSEKEDAFDRLWKDIKDNYLKQLAKGVKAEAQQAVPYSDEEWGELINKKGIILDFNTPIKSDLISLFLTGDDTSARELDGIYKIMLLPWEDVNNNQVFYIYDGERIHRYVLPFSKNGLSRDEFDKIYSYYSDPESGKRQCSTVTEIGKTDKPIPVRPDVFFPKGSRFGDYYDYTSSVPELLTSKATKASSDYSSIENAVVGERDSNYDSTVSPIDNALVFKNINNVFRIHNNGLLEYKYISSPGETENTNLNKAFENAVTFIEKRKSLIEGDTAPLIYLSGVSRQKDYIEFTFDYVINGMTINTDYYLNGEDNSALKNAITIRANSKRVINAWWVVMKFEQSKNTVRYNDSFTDLISNYFDDYKQLTSDSNFFMEDVRLSYVIKNIGEKQLLKPMWVVATSDGKVYSIPARQKGGG